ncbi:hypothetical protein BDQ94DRAFT_138580 [Aspergillus welwitschiae]|uniref:Uncharacterized protein n=4 Tax=Aspergillus TaxID=5052 RepID=A0A3F3QAB3_9EURO|nr:hypothetical protein BDQ94DRAFT_138580 [Aspergillus welwitschiae]RDH36109.1 hypothetical protein BDQ94DRAFT_138580 [Aspergillus welwitschiae]|eukprot:XP_001394467.2 hypothetical protein ANI_1_650094 [Aspergillus niger CBS 513.88]
MTMNACKRMLPGLRSVATKSVFVPARSFSVSSPFMREAAPTLPTKKPVGAFRGGLFGFLTGAIAASAGVYFYILGEYRIANEMLTEDIIALQGATQKLQTYIGELERKVDQLQKKK